MKLPDEFTRMRNAGDFDHWFTPNPAYPEHSSLIGIEVADLRSIGQGWHVECIYRDVTQNRFASSLSRDEAVRVATTWLTEHKLGLM